MAAKIIQKSTSEKKDVTGGLVIIPSGNISKHKTVTRIINHYNHFTRFRDSFVCIERRVRR